MSNMTSVCICTYNPNMEVLERTVTSILTQDYRPEDFELIIIDNNSAFPVAEIPFIKNNKICVVTESRQGLTAARRKAVETAKGELLVFVDDDNVLDKNYIGTANEAFKDGSLGIISGNIHPEYKQEPDKWFFQFEEMLAIRRFPQTGLIINQSEYYNSLFPIGAGMCIRKELIWRYYFTHLNDGNYIEGRKAADLSSAEDIDLDFYAIYNNYKIGICPLLNITHIIPKDRTSFSYISKLTRGSLKSTYLVNLKWAKSFRHPVFKHFNFAVPYLLFRTIIHKIFSFNKAHAIKYIYFSNILKYKWNRRQEYF
jgi:glycosyltransferase involved in cell wall biosynthesis